MPDEIGSQFQVRRPMLQHVADALREEITELLADEDVPARTAFTVATTEVFLSRLKQSTSEYLSPLVEMPDQVSGTIEVYKFEHVAACGVPSWRASDNTLILLGPERKWSSAVASTHLCHPTASDA